MQRVNEKEKPAPGGEYVRSLARGLSLLCAFNENNRRMTISQAAEAIDVDRATARRLLLTLVQEEFAGTDGADFYLLPRALQIGYSYLRSGDLGSLCRSALDRFSRAHGVTASAGVLSDGEVLYIARSVRQSPITINIEVGMKVPIYRSSIGRVFLASLEPAQVNKYIADARIDRRTDKSLVDRSELQSAVNLVRESGYALVDEELELGLRTIAVPVRDADGRVVAGISAATIGGGSAADMLRLLDPLRRTSEEISLGLKDAAE